MNPIAYALSGSWHRRLSGFLRVLKCKLVAGEHEHHLRAAAAPGRPEVGVAFAIASHQRILRHQLGDGVGHLQVDAVGHFVSESQLYL